MTTGLILRLNIDPSCSYQLVAAEETSQRDAELPETGRVEDGTTAEED